MPSTLRTELIKCNFDQENGKMVVQYGTGLQTPGAAHEVEWSNVILDQRFSNGHNNYDAPRFIASDKKHVYVIENDARNGTYMRAIAKNALDYLHSGTPVPYPEE